LKDIELGIVTIEFPEELLTLIDKIAKARKTSRTALIKKLVLEGLAGLTYPAENAKPTSGVTKTPGVIPNKELREAVNQGRFILTGEGDLNDPEIRRLAIHQEIVEHGQYEKDKGWKYRGRFVPVSNSPPKLHKCYLDDLGSEFK
jgi:hypothetical protein